MRPELRLRVMAGATPTWLTLTASVGKPTNATSLRISVLGYKRRFDGAGFTSGAGEQRSTGCPLRSGSILIRTLDWLHRP